MIMKVEGILIGSKNATNLAKFYRETIGLKQTMEFEMGEEGETKGFAFEMDGCSIFITDHSKVKGKNTQPDRIIFNLEVDNIEKEVARLDKANVTKIQSTYHVEDYGFIATFEDPDGNYFQLVQVRAGK